MCTFLKTSNMFDYWASMRHSIGKFHIFMNDDIGESYNTQLIFKAVLLMSSPASSYYLFWLLEQMKTKFKVVLVALPTRPQTWHWATLGWWHPDYTFHSTSETATENLFNSTYIFTNACIINDWKHWLVGKHFRSRWLVLIPKYLPGSWLSLKWGEVVLFICDCNRASLPCNLTSPRPY